MPTVKEDQQRSTYLPAWFRQELPDVSKIESLKKLLQGQALATVCEHARCPNLGQCWGRGVATFMILGSVCTRNCLFCAVADGKPAAVDSQEPRRVAETVMALGLRYVVITSVTRDDLPDQGVRQFVDTVAALRAIDPDIKIELLIPDFAGRQDLIQRVVDAGPDVLGHNMEMAQRLFPLIRPRADYRRSLNVLRMIKQQSGRILVKSGFMVGLGETDSEVNDLMADLKAAGCDMLTIGQYLRPSRDDRHVPVRRFVTPDGFVRYQEMALAMGFRHVFSGPLVRSSYIAEAAYEACVQ